MERNGVAMMASHLSGSVGQDQLLPEVYDEVDRLPEKYRQPIVLCYLEGLTHEEAAGQLRLPVGTVKIRLARARQRLRGRLIRRGLAPSLLTAWMAREARGSIPGQLVTETVQGAIRIASGRMAEVSASIAALVEGVLRAMFLSRL
jgi:hypothetical protein